MIKKKLQKLLKILEIFGNWEDFEKVIEKLHEIFLFAYFFSIKFCNIYVSGKYFGEPVPPSTAGKYGGGPPGPPHGPPMPPIFVCNSPKAVKIQTPKYLVLIAEFINCIISMN